MIPQEITRYLMGHELGFTRHWHPRAVSAQKLAEALHISGKRVAKAVVIEADGVRVLALVPATRLLDLDLAAAALRARSVRLVDESEFGDLFPRCELGAEPPFGGLYGIPVIADEALAGDLRIAFRAGSHEETLEMDWHDFAELESPLVARLSRPNAARDDAASRPAPAPEVTLP